MVKAYEKVLTPVTYGDNAEHLVKLAHHFAQFNQSSIILLHVLEKNLIFPSYEFLAPYAPGLDMKKLAKEGEEFMAKLALKMDLKAYAGKVLTGYTANKILEMAEEQNIDLILLGSHRYTSIDLLLGSTTNNVLQGAKCDVYIVKKESFSIPKKILLPIDFMPEMEAVILRAKDLAEHYQAELYLIHVMAHMPAYGAPVNMYEKEIIEKMKGEIQKLKNTYHLERAKTELIPGVAKYEIGNYASDNNIDLIIMGSHGKHGVQLLLGSVANGVLNRAACDVLAVRV